MPVLNIRIIELLTREKRSSVNYLHVLAHTKNEPNKISKMKITTNKKGNVLICENPICFKIDSQLDDFLYVDFKRHRMIISDDLLGRLVLPLEWFPTNHVVREWFPISKQGRGQYDAMILLDVHVDCRHVAPFMAPFATLKVIPTWQRPTLCKNAEVAVNPPCVYVISDPLNFGQHNIQTTENNLPPHYQIYQPTNMQYQNCFLPMPKYPVQNEQQQMFWVENQQRQIHVNAQPQIISNEQQFVSVDQLQRQSNPYQMNSNNNNNYDSINDERTQNQMKSNDETSNQQTNFNVQKKQPFVTDFQKQNLANSQQNQSFSFKRPKSNQIIHQSLLSDQQQQVYYPQLPQYPNPYN